MFNLLCISLLLNLNLVNNILFLFWYLWNKEMDRFAQINNTGQILEERRIQVI